MAKTQKSVVVRLWRSRGDLRRGRVRPRTADRLVPLQVDPDVVYGHKMGMALTFDVLKPTTANGAGVLFMVSGGWVSKWAPPAADREAVRGSARPRLHGVRGAPRLEPGVQGPRRRRRRAASDPLHQGQRAASGASTPTGWESSAAAPAAISR